MWILNYGSGYTFTLQASQQKIAMVVGPTSTVQTKEAALLRKVSVFVSTFLVESLWSLASDLFCSVIS